MEGRIMARSIGFAAALLAAFGILLSGCATLRAREERARKMVIAEDGTSTYAIVVAEDASPSTRHGAQELQRFLGEMTGATLPIIPDTASLGAHEIVLGNNAHLEQLGVDIDFEALGDEGYVIRTVGDRLVIAGGDLRGTMYGIYGLLEDHLGCRWFTPEVNRIPKHDALRLPSLNDRQVPVLEYREPFTIDCFDGDWCARNRMNSSSGRLDEQRGGKVRFGAGMFVHTFDRLVPPDTYFEEHPEYFSEIGGQRIKDHTQLCCTNEDVIRLCTEGTLAAMRADPEAFVFSVSQNDWGNYCQCERCQALAQHEESQMAPVLHLVNRVAEAVEGEFPGKAIETLAYQWTRKPCRTMRPRHNVIVRLCSIECCFMHPLATCDMPANQSFRRDTEAWARMADRLWVWNYVTSFRHFLVPFPNLHVRRANIRFFVENNVTGIFEQDNYRSLNGELSALNGYITAKFLWNPDYDENLAIDEFLEGVYGEAAKPIRKYIDLLHTKVVKENIHANIWVGPADASYLDDAILAKADRLWDKAEERAADQPEVLERVKIARLCVEYAHIERARVAGSSPYRVDHKAFRVEAAPPFLARVRSFFDVARKANVTWIDEWRMTLDAYEDYFREMLDNPVQIFAPLEPVEVLNPKPGLAYAYYEGEFDILLDFGVLEPVAEGRAKGFDRDVRQRTEHYALRFNGYIEVPRDGIYTFYLKSDDGARLYIGDRVVVDNDGVHGALEKSGVLALRAGLHPVTVTYFELTGGEALEVMYEGPGVAKRWISADMLSH